MFCYLLDIHKSIVKVGKKWLYLFANLAISNQDITMKILISPAKSLDYSRQFKTPDVTQAVFLKEANELAGKLSKLSVQKIGELMHLSTQLAELNYERFKFWQSPLQLSENCQPAVNVFTGEVYKGLDVDSFSQKDYQVAQENLRILSGLYGILKPLDLMYPYRLEMGTRWQMNTKAKNLYQFWGDKVTNALKAELKPNEPIINLASTEYSKVIQFKKIENPVITPIFKELKGDKFQVIMMYAKHARGAMARDIIQQNYKNINDLKAYHVDGYSYNEAMSSEHEWVFVR
jgi:cytoplasmic iron level regulating protein YaaA (DUF328/UPF0246 family)